MGGPAAGPTSTLEGLAAAVSISVTRGPPNVVRCERASGAGSTQMLPN